MSTLKGDEWDAYQSIIERVRREQKDQKRMVAITDAMKMSLGDYIAKTKHDETGYTNAPTQLLRMLAMRLRVAAGALMPFDFIQAHAINNERVVLFIVHKDTPMMLEDDGNLFPSDALITKLRLLTRGE